MKPHYIWLISGLIFLAAGTAAYAPHVDKTMALGIGALWAIIAMISVIRFVKDDIKEDRRSAGCCPDCGRFLSEGSYGDRFCKCGWTDIGEKQ